MLRVALTGGFATGKSYVLDQIRHRGIPCLDADELAHGVTAAGTEATMEIARRFGEGILAPDGSVDRTKLGPIVFADSAARRDLEAIVHPAVYRTITAGLRAFDVLGGHTLAVVAVPLLYETGRDKDYDRIIVTACPASLQIQRLVERGMSEEAARERLAAQMPTESKTSRADYVIDTAGSFAETDRQIDEVLGNLKSI